ncbi:cytochrome P450 [Mycena capillaripes]|nr:cytochrome P450 [Mycena capillaripes]
MGDILQVGSRIWWICPIVRLNVLSTTIIVLNDVAYATDMLEKKSRIYSNRPRLVMGGKLVGWDQGPALIQFVPGGADTTAVVIQTLFLALILHPEAQRKAQDELDAVLGLCTALQLSDRPHLPYIEAFILEIFCFYPITPLGLPHVVAEDNVYNGFFIPKGSMIITSNRRVLPVHFCHDSNLYTNPETFSPEHFIETVTHTKCQENPRFQPPILRSDPRILRSDLWSDLRYPPTFPPLSQTPSGRIPALRMALRM